MRRFVSQSIASRASGVRFALLAFIYIHIFIKTHPAISFTKPRASSTSNMLRVIPALILPARSSHSACRTAGSAFSSAHLVSGRWPRAGVCILRTHCRQVDCRDRDKCISKDISVESCCCDAINRVGGRTTELRGIYAKIEHVLIGQSYPITLASLTPPAHLRIHLRTTSRHLL